MGELSSLIGTRLIYDDYAYQHLISLRQVLSATKTTRSANAAPFRLLPHPTNTTIVLFPTPPSSNFGTTASYYPFGLYAYVLITLMVLGIRKAIQRKYILISMEGAWKISLEKTTLDSNLDLPIISSLVYCKSSALDHAATEDTRPSKQWRHQSSLLKYISFKRDLLGGFIQLQGGPDSPTPPFFALDSLHYAPANLGVQSEKVLCFHGPLIYEAKCLDCALKDEQPRYFIHYAGWNKKFAVAKFSLPFSELGHVWHLVITLVEQETPIVPPTSVVGNVQTSTRMVWDEWVPESRVLKYNDSNVQRQKELQRSHEADPQNHYLD
uniref:Tudor-knot domain-containing protein n=1 Tax=Timema tahoe TaxID=61484 RepID=A0A7R9IMV2_9NEOP|nr:unnamed protein product [Timema tahoe]